MFSYLSMFCVLCLDCGSGKSHPSDEEAPGNFRSLSTQCQ